MNKEWDVFICHAGEDKRDLVEPLAKELDSRGLRVWYDRWELTIGDSLRRKIDEGLANSRYGVVVLSPDFFRKQWPQRELDGLVQKELDGRKVILPVWHNVTRDEVKSFSPPLADKLAGSTNLGVSELAEQLARAIDPNEQNATSNSGKVQVSAPPAIVRISYSELNITNRLHRYSLKANLTLNVPPDQSRFRLNLLWPKDVRIARLANLREGERKCVDRFEYLEIWLDSDERLFPGQTVEVIGLGSQYRLDYEYDDRIWLEMDNNPRDLHYTLYLEDHMPIAGTIPFKDLNVF